MYTIFPVPKIKVTLPLFPVRQRKKCTKKNPHSRAMSTMNGITPGDVVKPGVNLPGHALPEAQSISAITPEDIATPPPPLPHVEMNIVPLSVLIRNLSVYTYNELATFIKTQQHNDDPEAKKLAFLQLIVKLRSHFLRMYVLIKWCKTLKNNNFNTLIDLLNWFRTTNQLVNNSIWTMKNVGTLLMNAKLPNPDLVTALQVLSNGRPLLPSHNLINQLTLSPQFILSFVRQTNVALYVKLARCSIPTNFASYTIHDGKVRFTVEDEFTVSLSCVDGQFFFIDCVLFEDLVLPASFGKTVNEMLVKSAKPLHDLYYFLHKYCVTLKIYLIHGKLLTLEKLGKYNGNLSHAYDSKNSLITIKYWTRMKARACIEIGMDNKTNNNMVLRWFIKDRLQDTVVLSTDLVVENLIDEITFRHSKMIMSSYKLPMDENDDLLFEVSVGTVVILKINPITGFFYFKNPSPLYNQYIKDINSDPSRLLDVLQRLKLSKQVFHLSSIFKTTGWIANDVIKMTSEKLPLTPIERLLYFRLHTWPLNWFLVVKLGIDGEVQLYVGKIVCEKGTWFLKVLDHVAHEQQLTYKKVHALQRQMLDKIINYLVVDSLMEQGVDVALTKLGLAIRLSTLLGQTQHLFADVMFVELESTEEKRILKLTGKMLKKNANLPPFAMIEYLPEDKFRLQADVVDLNDTKDVLLFLRDQLLKVTHIVSVVDTLRESFSEGAEVLSVDKDKIEFQYGPNYRCDFVYDDKSMKVELSPDNPQFVIQKYLGKVHTKTLKYLQETKQFFQFLGDFKGIFYIHDLTRFQLIKDRANIAIELREVNKKQYYYVSFTQKPESKDPAHYFNVKTGVFSSMEGIICLNIGCCCDDTKIASVVNRLLG